MASKSRNTTVNLCLSEILNRPFARVCSRILKQGENSTSNSCLLSYQDRNNANVKVFVDTIAPAHGRSSTRLENVLMLR